MTSTTTTTHCTNVTICITYTTVPITSMTITTTTTTITTTTNATTTVAISAIAMSNIMPVTSTTLEIHAVPVVSLREQFTFSSINDSQCCFSSKYDY